MMTDQAGGSPARLTGTLGGLLQARLTSMIKKP
jgi:hypothetical protein